MSYKTVQEKVNAKRAEYREQLDLHKTHDVEIYTFIHHNNTIQPAGRKHGKMREDGKILTSINHDGRQVGLHWRKLGTPQDGRAELVELTPQLRAFLKFNPDETDPNQENFCTQR